MSAKKTLFIVRHAKSSWDIEGISDIDRPLKLRGIRAAYEMSRRLKIELQLPDKIIASPANRAIHTALIFNRVFEKNSSKMIIDERLYGTGLPTIIKLITEQPDSIKKLMICGHNPDFSELATKFTGGDYIELPTCGICCVTFEADKWDAISSGNVVDYFVDIPKKNELKYID